MKKYSTGQGYIRKEVTSYKIHILGRYVPCSLRYFTLVFVALSWFSNSTLNKFDNIHRINSGINAFNLWQVANLLFLFFCQISNFPYLAIMAFVFLDKRNVIIGTVVLIVIFVLGIIIGLYRLIIFRKIFLCTILFKILTDLRSNLLMK